VDVLCQVNMSVVRRYFTRQPDMRLPPARQTKCRNFSLVARVMSHLANGRARESRCDEGKYDRTTSFALISGDSGESRRMRSHSSKILTDSKPSPLAILRDLFYYSSLLSISIVITRSYNNNKKNSPRKLSEIRSSVDLRRYDRHDLSTQFIISQTFIATLNLVGPCPSRRYYIRNLDRRGPVVIAGTMLDTPRTIGPI